MELIQSVVDTILTSFGDFVYGFDQDTLKIGCVRQHIEQKHIRVRLFTNCFEMREVMKLASSIPDLVTLEQNSEWFEIDTVMSKINENVNHPDQFEIYAWVKEDGAVMELNYYSKFNNQVKYQLRRFGGHPGNANTWVDTSWTLFAVIWLIWISNYGKY